MKKVFVIGLLFAVVWTLTACSNTPPQAEPRQTGGLLEEIKKRGEIRIGTEGTYKPFSFRDEKTNELTGYDVEVAREVARRLGVKAVFVETPWDAMMTGLKTGRFDTVANQVSITEERKKPSISPTRTRFPMPKSSCMRKTTPSKGSKI